MFWKTGLLLTLGITKNLWNQKIFIVNSGLIWGLNHELNNAQLPTLYKNNSGLIAKMKQSKYKKGL